MGCILKSFKPFIKVWRKGLIYNLSRCAFHGFLQAWVPNQQTQNDDSHGKMGEGGEQLS